MTTVPTETAGAQRELAGPPRAAYVPIPAFVPAAPERERTPPVPGSVWCKSCDAWCTPSGMCRCNNR